ncbi:hypothetical protein [Anaeroselena agilis]|uniref:Uncharacterized protein n=1 Tax=Anaeroselena agilis TaxID=3063788 RepID=A0ABU3NZM9_9FIRM|nr:hypothetical protein [Selenomonadales bacterium 4137-cl]
MKTGSAFFTPGPGGSARESRRRETADKYLAGRKRERRPRGLARLLVVVLCMFVAGFFFDNTVPAPAAAWVYADLDQRVYYPPPYLENSGRDAAGLLLTTAGEAKKMNCAPDPQAKSKGYFRQPDRSMSGRLLQSLGILKPLPGRWNRDGTWNW